MSYTKKVIFCKIRSNIGIQGSHKADLLAKSAFDIVPDENSKMATAMAR